MALSLGTALQIFTNPKDLQVWVQEDGGKWGFSISRGPSGKYRVLVDSNGFAENREAAVKGLSDTLKAVSKTCRREFRNPASTASQYLNPNKERIDSLKILNSESIAQIVQGLRLCDSVRTYEMLTPRT